MVDARDYGAKWAARPELMVTELQECLDELARQMQFQQEDEFENIVDVSIEEIESPSTFVYFKPGTPLTTALRKAGIYEQADDSLGSALGQYSALETLWWALMSHAVEVACNLTPDLPADPIVWQSLSDLLEDRVYADCLDVELREVLIAARKQLTSLRAYCEEANDSHTPVWHAPSMTFSAKDYGKQFRPQAKTVQSFFDAFEKTGWRQFVEIPEQYRRALRTLRALEDFPIGFREHGANVEWFWVDSTTTAELPPNRS